MNSPRLRLYHYWRSSASWRVRWGFALKGIKAEMVAVDLLSGEVEGSEHRQRNPMGQVPTLEFLDETDPKRRFLAESVAILEWADEVFPKTHRLLPGDAFQRARIRHLAEIINAGTQPLQNLTPMFRHSDDPDERKRWSAYFIQAGLEAYETMVQQTAGIYSVGDQITLADLCVIPQCYNAGRYDVPMEQFPILNRIYRTALATSECQASVPEKYEPAKT